MSKETKSFSILIAALGGEGGGVLSDWIVSAASAMAFPVQSTSVPGVAQRTGATNYYIELFPLSRDELGGAAPVFALTPSPGRVDLVAATELMEAGRTLQNGFTHPERTTLVASTHREYAVAEIVVPGDGRYNGQKVIESAHSLTRKAHLFDMRQIAMQHGTVINSVLFGAMLGTGVLPLSRQACEDAIRQSGKSVKASLNGFNAGFDAVANGAPQAAVATGGVAAAASDKDRPAASSFDSIIESYPEPLRAILRAGVAQLIDYQDADYASLYLDRMHAVHQAGNTHATEAVSEQDRIDVTRETARYLALWMSYEDVIRVADLKSRAQRLQRVRDEVGAGPSDPLRVTEYLKPGLDELCSILPRSLANWLQARLKHRAHQLSVGIHLRSDTILGFAVLCVLRSLRPLRPRTWRFHREQETINRWLACVRHSLGIDGALARELSLSGNVVKGYGETNERGHRNLATILALAGQSGQDVAELTRQVRTERLRALAEGETPTPTVTTQGPVIKPISFVPRSSISTRSD
ncbi:indolepyruvate oxidoreductase subunit beta family protein [Lacisediminimonas sp.]|uniref:indolepyruvate oxidoreductase subunit beta family protein n=1 Tax=Lacisediminimonas sp. TaxID=3060582 RepID=UPI002717300F|nr:indolepyruvate oxidoreductase subunit beta family protein [Lacisediminimonas sp.]MDO8300575.1 indolepyruvate oxidoreductase subunit beta family protein [Lacisediminimonas sp.]